jgi:hypothetical protein
MAKSHDRLKKPISKGFFKAVSDWRRVKFLEKKEKK